MYMNIFCHLHEAQAERHSKLRGKLFYFWQSISTVWRCHIATFSRSLSLCIYSCLCLFLPPPLLCFWNTGNAWQANLLANWECTVLFFCFEIVASSTLKEIGGGWAVFRWEICRFLCRKRNLEALKGHENGLFRIKVKNFRKMVSKYYAELCL